MIVPVKVEVGVLVMEGICVVDGVGLIVFVKVEAGGAGAVNGAGNGDDFFRQAVNPLSPISPTRTKDTQVRALGCFKSSLRRMVGRIIHPGGKVPEMQPNP